MRESVSARCVTACVRARAVKILTLFNQWDEDGNGLVNFDEFVTGLRAVRGGHRTFAQRSAGHMQALLTFLVFVARSWA